METPRPSSDEIDLLYFIARVYQFLLRNWLIIVVSIGSCIIVSWFLFKRAPAVYESRMVVFSEFLSESYARQIITNLDNALHQGSPDAFSRLGLSPEQGATVTKLSLESALSDRVLEREDDKHTFVISAEVTDPAVLPALQKGIVAAIGNSEYVRRRVAERRKGYEALIDKLDKEIALVTDERDVEGSLYHKTVPKRIFGEDRTTRAALFDPSTMRVFMYKDRIEAQGKLALLTGLEVVDPFVPALIPVRPKLSFYLASGFSTGLMITAVLLAIQSLQALSKKYPA